MSPPNVDSSSMPMVACVMFSIRAAWWYCFQLCLSVCVSVCLFVCLSTL